MKNAVTIFCSASNEIDPKYNEAARELVLGLCRAGFSIISGGSFLGTMGAVSRAVTEAGGTHRGVLPKFMEGLDYEGLSERVWTPTMSSRKEEMRRGSIAAIALPGGIGTFDELFETHVLRKLKQYDGAIFVLDIDGFFAPYRALLEHCVATGMLTPHDRDLVHFCATPAQLLQEISSLI